MQKAYDCGVTVLALTDHDTTAGLSEAAKKAKVLGLEFYNGIEFDCSHPTVGGRFHILGYGIDPNHPALSDCCRDFAQQRAERAERIFTYLQQKGMPLAKETVLVNVSGVIGRPHFARAMVEAGYVPDTKAAFDQYLDTDEFRTIDRLKPHPKEAIEKILEAGGIPVLAHPVQLKLGEMTLQGLLEELMGYGLQGLECHYSTHTPEETAIYLTLAEQNSLLVSVGSDFHGETSKPDIHLGTGKNNQLCIKEPVSLVSALRTR